MSLPGRSWSLAVASFLVAGAALAAEPFPDPRPATAAEAASSLARIQPAPRDGACVLPRVVVLADRSAGRRGSAIDRAVTIIADRTGLPAERVWISAGLAVRYTASETAIDGVDPADTDRNGLPDVVQSVAGGLEDARSFLVEGLGLPAPDRFEVALRELGDSLDSVVLAVESDAPTWAVLDATPCAGVEGARQAALHTFARAVAHELAPTFPRGWAEALAHWVRLELGGASDPALARLLTDRLQRLDLGLFTKDPRLAAGNAAWLSYVDAAFGRPALVATIEELAHGDPQAALSRALARAAGTDLARAFRDFHVWSLQTGRRADRHHFPFAARLGDPRFASESDGLPALSIHADPAVAPWGAAQIRLGPDRREGGLSVHFEGDFSARWQADLLLVGDDGAMRRLPLAVSDESRAQATVPLDGLTEAFLLVRHLGGGDETPRRYNYSAHREPGFPFEVTALEAREVDEPAGGVLVSWETAAEHGVVGYDVLRVREGGGREVVVNPVWIPAVGDEGAPASYHYLDASAQPGVSYLYRVRASTTLGLESTTDSILVRRPELPAR
jgi:hypothetical protein